MWYVNASALFLALAIGLHGEQRKPSFTGWPGEPVQSFFGPRATVTANIAPPVWDCYKVRSLKRVSDSQYEAVAENTCGYEIRSVYVLVKFFDAEWNRIGVDAYGSAWIAPGEKQKTLLTVPDYVQKRYKHVAVRKITTDPKDLY